MVFEQIRALRDKWIAPATKGQSSERDYPLDYTNCARDKIAFLDSPMAQANFSSHAERSCAVPPRPAMLS
jgi:hypothetical protein